MRRRRVSLTSLDLNGVGAASQEPWCLEDYTYRLKLVLEFHRSLSGLYRPSMVGVVRVIPNEWCCIREFGDVAAFAAVELCSFPPFRLCTSDADI